MTTKRGFVYILKDATGSFYVGSTTDPKRRMLQHTNGHTQTTSRMKSPCLVLLQEYETIQDARRVEMKIKKLKRKDYIEKMVQNGTITLKP